ncbi:MAG TPA: hypothetical protein DCX17_02115 [Firmicutes bacterium]|jgi:thioredoxin-related protein|nr:hypothetical protein [Bacillota bacterium]
MMKKISLILFVITSLFQDSGQLPKLNDYRDVFDLHIAYFAILQQPHASYDVYIYSPSCGYCNELKPLMISLALSSDSIIFFVEATSEISFGHQSDRNDQVCQQDDIVIPGYPIILCVRNQCVIRQIVGVSKIKDYYGCLS